MNADLLCSGFVRDEGVFSKSGERGGKGSDLGFGYRIPQRRELTGFLSAVGDVELLTTQRCDG